MVFFPGFDMAIWVYRKTISYYLGITHTNNTLYLNVKLILFATTYLLKN